MKHLPLLLALALSLCAACNPPPATTTTKPAAPTLPTSVRLTGEIFASDWQVTIVARDASTLARTRTLQPAIEAALKEVDRELSLWNRDSELARFNRIAWTKTLPLSPTLMALIETALRVGRDTDGAFDITLGPVLDVWGFSPATKGKVTAPPTAEQIAAARAKTGLSLLHPGEGGLQKDQADAVVDLTAIGDGAAAAAVATVLVERGFGDFLVDVAGEVVVSGHGLKGPWKVGVNVPNEDAAADAVEQTVVVDTTGTALRALSTSGTYREAFTADGKRYPHILDPRTAAPVTHDLVSCTVVGPDVVVADALSTACVVLGVDGTKAVLPRFAGYSALFLTAQPDKTFAATVSEGFPALSPTAPAGAP